MLGNIYSHKFCNEEPFNTWRYNNLGSFCSHSNDIGKNRIFEYAIVPGRNSISDR